VDGIICVLSFITGQKKVFFIYEAPTPGQILMQYVKKFGFLCFKCTVSFFNFFTSNIKKV